LLWLLVGHKLLEAERGQDVRFVSQHNIERKKSEKRRVKTKRKSFFRVINTI
jgi:hypothetical protein